MSLNQILTSLNNGDLKSAEVVAMEMYQLDPSNYDVIKVLGLINLLHKDFTKSIEYYEISYQKRNDDYDVILNLAFAYSENFDVEKSDRLLNRALQKDEKDARIYFNLAENQIKRRNFQSAFDYILKCLELNGGLIPCAQNPGLNDTVTKYLDICLSLNKRELLIESYTKILDDQFNSEVFAHWCNFDDSSISQKYIHEAKQKLNERYPNEMLKSKNLVSVYFSLAQLSKNDQKLSEQYYILGNKCISYILRYNPIVEQRRIKKLKKIFSNKNILNLTSKSLSKGDGLIFIVGLPRSGTTLTESILSTADKIISAGETTIMGSLTKKFQIPNDEEYHIDHEDIQNIGDEYLRMINALSSKNNSHIIDKMPGNFFNIGFILLSLPAAKIINLSRDPWDNATSLFQQNYITNIPYSSSFFNIGVHQANYYELIKFWQDCNLINQENYIEISYKDLVSDTNNVAKKLFKFCNLSGEYNEESRSGFFARTASKNQVTKSVYKSSLNKQIFEDFKVEFFESFNSQAEYWK